MSLSSHNPDGPLDERVVGHALLFFCMLEDRSLAVRYEKVLVMLED